MKALLFTLFSVLLLTSCIGNIEKGPLRYNANGKTSFNQLALKQLTDTLSPQCLKCHDWIKDEAQIIRRIVPGDVDSSPLFKVLVNGSMPKNSSPLTSAELEIIRAQIMALNSPNVVIPPAPIKTEFTILKETFLTDKCVVCHSRMKEEAGFQRGLVPGEPEKSKTYKAIVSGKMPLNYKPITSAELALVHDYISDLGTTEPKVSFEQIKKEVLGPKCIECHKGMKEEAGIQWGVVAGKPDESKIYKAMTNGSMPKQIKPVSDDELLMLRNYIKNLQVPEQP